MKYLLDTNICIYLIKKQSPELTRRVIRRLANLGLSSITLAELEYGVANSARAAEARAALTGFSLAFEVFDFDVRAAAHYGRIRKELKDKGQPVGNMDMLIAAVALAHDLTLVTHNEREFRRISGLKWGDWKGI